MANNIKFVITRFVFFKLKMHQNLFSVGAPPRTPLGSLRRSPDPLVGWGGEYPLPILLPTRRLRRLELGAGALVLRPPQHKILATPVVHICTSLEIFRNTLNILCRGSAWTQDKSYVSVICWFRARMWQKAGRCLCASRQSLLVTLSALPVHMLTRLTQFGVPSCRRKGSW